MSVDTIAEAFALLADPRGAFNPDGNGLARDNYRAVAALVDQIASMSYRPN